MVAVAIIAFLGALVLGFLGGRDSMMSELKRKEDELEGANALNCKLEQEKKELCRQVDHLSKRLFNMEIDSGIFDIPDNENWEE